MQSKEKITKDFFESVEKHGLIEGIYITFGETAKFSLNFNPKICSLSLDELSLSVRGYNVLKRNGLNTIGDVVDAINGKTLITLRNLGKKTLQEIIINVVNLGYSQLGNEQKRALLTKIAETNINSVRD